MPVEGEKASPMATFVTTLQAMAATRKLLSGAAQALGDPAWRIFLEDLEMMLNERMVIGLRTPWIRRVAVPVLQAHRALLIRTDADRAKKALEILRQCTDENVKAECMNWVRKTFNVE